MSFILKLGVSGKVPSPSQLEYGQLALNFIDGKLYYKTASNTIQNLLDKSIIGLSNVDNTSDINKPISTATQTALSLKANLDGATFTAPVYVTTAVEVRGNSPSYVLNDLTAPADRRYWRWYLDGGVFRLENVNDAFNAIVLTPLSINSDGIATFTSGTNYMARFSAPASAFAGYVGCEFTASSASASTPITIFHDFKNELGIPVTHIHHVVDTDGGSQVTIGTTPPGSRLSDRRIERLRIDSAGILGLGVTPNAWGAVKAMQISNSLSLWGNPNGGGYINNNAYFDGSTRRYVFTQAASEYVQAGGAHIWSSAPSGTAGNPITFTDRMTLDVNGRLVLNSSSSYGVFNSSLAANAYWTLQASGLTYGYIGQASATTGGASTDYGIRSEGNLIFGAGGYGEDVRIDTSGRLLVGSTSAVYAATLTLKSATNSYSITLSRVGAGNGTLGHLVFETDAGAIGTIQTNGSSTIYNTSSDHRLKANVRDADAKRFMSIKFRDFEWVIDGRHDCGVIAHELQSIYPDLVYGDKDATEEVEYEVTPAVSAVFDDAGNEIIPAAAAVMGTKTLPKYQQVNYTGLIARMGTVVQQQHRAILALQTQVVAQNTAMQALTDRLSALETKVV